jgi:hypothetical protein
MSPLKGKMFRDLVFELQVVIDSSSLKSQKNICFREPYYKRREGGRREDLGLLQYDFYFINVVEKKDDF